MYKRIVGTYSCELQYKRLVKEEMRKKMVNKSQWKSFNLWLF
jgi:hypothetical protein